MELKPNFENLIKEINAVNHAWKEASEVLLEANSGLATSLRDLKTRLQIRLLRNSPQQVYLLPDENTESKEALSGLILQKPISKYWNAAHIPVRVAEEMLTPEELIKCLKTVNAEESPC